MHDRGKYRHNIGNRHYSAYCHYWLFSSEPNDFSGALAGDQDYSTGIVEGTLLYFALESCVLPALQLETGTLQPALCGKHYGVCLGALRHTGTRARNRHYSTGTMEGALPHLPWSLASCPAPDLRPIFARASSTPGVKKSAPDVCYR